MKYYFHALYKSFSEPAWLAQQYRQVGKASTFFVFILLVISIALAFHISYIQIPAIAPVFKTTIQNEIPDFTATIAEGGVLNVTELAQPYTYYFDHEGESRVIVIDTISTSTPTLESFFTTSTQSGFLVTQHAIISKYSSSSAIVEETFDRLPQASLSKTQIVELLDNISNRFKPAIFAALTTLTFVVWGIGLLVFVLIFASITYLIYMSVSKTDIHLRYTWKEVLTLSLFTFGLPKLLMTMLTLIFSTSFGFVVSGAMAFGVARALSIPKSSEQQYGSEEMK